MPMAETDHTTSNIVNLAAERTDGPGPLAETRQETKPSQVATVCPVAELDRRAQDAMAEADAAEERLFAEPKAAYRAALEMERDKARDRAHGLRDAMTYATARSKRGLQAQLLQLDSVVGSLAWAPEIKAVGRDYEADRAARIVALIRECVEALVPDDV